MRNQFAILKPYLEELIERIKGKSYDIQLQLWNAYADSVAESPIYSMDDLNDYFYGFSASDLIECLDSDFSLAHDYFQMDGWGFYKSFDWKGLDDCQVHDIAVEILTADKHEKEYYPFVFFRDLKNDYEQDMEFRNKKVEIEYEYQDNDEL